MRCDPIRMILHMKFFCGFLILGQPDETYILPVLSALSTFLIQKQMTGAQPDAEGPQAMQTKIMKVAMPLFYRLD